LSVSGLNLVSKYASQIFNENFTTGSGFTLPNVRLNLSQILSVVPTIEESLPLRSSNELCAKHSRFVLRSANQLEIWALKREYSISCNLSLCSLKEYLPSNKKAEPVFRKNFRRLII
jgi:hypothetical protein